MRQVFKVLAVGVFLLSASKVFAAPVTYTLNDAHSSFAFSVQHMMINTVPGQFDKFSGTISYDPADLDDSRADITIDTASIDTHVEKRDNHLKSPDFFDAAKYPTITFKGTKFIKSAITGDLTMHGVTKQITIPVVFSGPVKNMGGQSIGITGSTVINRQDWGVSWNKTLDSGGAVVGDTVTLNISIEADAKG